MILFFILEIKIFHFSFITGRFNLQSTNYTSWLSTGHEMRFYGIFISCFFFFFTKVYGQTSQCPQNIGFETGTLTNWQAYTGLISRTGDITINGSSVIPGRHTIFKYQSNQLDPYGKFPVTCPNGSLYSLKLGNENTGAQVDRVSYTFQVPVNQANYSIIYNYAVVFQNPDHVDYEQPKFTARVFDVASNQYVNCGSFEFVASSGLPGFQQASVGSSVFYKPWAPITINLFGYAGKTLRLEFTTNDCTRGGHFGYAYIDVNENCASPITGETYCAGNSFVKLSAPAGFKEYYWYDNNDFSHVLGTSNILTLSPAPPDLSRYALRIVPFPGLGCEDTLYTTIHASPDILTLNVKDTIVGCASGISLREKSITQGSSSNLVFSYFTDPDAQTYVPDPENVITSGTYYIRAVNAAGCTDIKPVVVKLDTSPSLIITNPDPVCIPEKVDITRAKVTAGSNSTLIYSYWKDKLATIPLNAPQVIDSAGIYYIKGISTNGCSLIMPVTVTIGTLPKVIANKVTGCATVNLTNAAVTTGSDGGLTYSYWTDAAATNALTAPENITSSGTYYIRGTSTNGCYSIASVVANVSPFPVFTVKTPAAVVYPATVNLTTAYAGSDSLTYTYWIDPTATTALTNPTAIQTSGTYYIKATSKAGCTLISPVVVVVNPPPIVTITAPNVFTPNGDGTNDYFRLSYVGQLQLSYFKIFNRYGHEVFQTKQLSDFWDGTFNGSKIPAGAYYWVLEGSDSFRKERVVRSGNITLIR